MIRLLLSVVIQLLANALGLIVAAYFLDGMTLTGPAFLIAVVIFTLVYAISQPLFTQMAMSRVPALRGGVALIATLVGLVVTAWVSDGLSIEGAETWLAATVIVWLVSLVGVLLLPLVLVKKRVEEKRG
ncbi:phage holin family protein [Nocardioides sp. GXQ0305]|uniref:phage holin family protein n=1 Tax=Nocardioides sp. GXQ0305 TaxID=3423912 RepID=UPI003D7CC877